MGHLKQEKWTDKNSKMEANDQKKKKKRFALSSMSISIPLLTVNWMDATRFRQRGICPVSIGMKRRIS